MILTETRFDLIAERAQDSKNMYLKGIFMESERKNRNGRQYQRSEIENAVKQCNEAAQNGRPIMGELDHPPSLEISLKNVSHQIVDMHMEGNNAVGKALILPTPSGEILKSLCEANVQVGVSSRGSGSVNESTGIVEGFSFITVDAVASPSAIDAYPTSIYEQLQMYRRGGTVYDLAEAVTQDKAAQKYFQKEMNKFIDELFNK